VSTVFWEDLNEDSPWLNGTEFKDKYRMTRSPFWLIVDMIRNHDIFKSPRKPQALVMHQLMMLLCFLGTEGNNMSDRKGRYVFRAGKGTIRCYKGQVIQGPAILDCLYNSYIKWPDQAEQRVITENVRTKFGLPNCVGVTDGALLSLAFRPSTDDYADYKGRKC
jgi:hypothetical protein